jgi:hypothetical protein
MAVMGRQKPYRYLAVAMVAPLLLVRVRMEPRASARG